jgi:hypothetical protein
MRPLYTYTFDGSYKDKAGPVSEIMSKFSCSDTTGRACSNFTNAVKTQSGDTEPYLTSLRTKDLTWQADKGMYGADYWNMRCLLFDWLSEVCP